MPVRRNPYNSSEEKKLKGEFEYDEETDSGAENEHEMYLNKQIINDEIKESNDEEEKKSYNVKNKRLHENDEDISQLKK